ncbi:MAG: SAM-dependent methyltransferase [Bacteriovoracaceae bacterium]|nr:SAM-dependent methyltransferase [Bacteriovoracaceae bacterium]
MKKKLYLIPTPLDEEGILEPQALSLLIEACLHPEQNIFAVEEHKVARRRWIRWGLPREMIEHFVEFNEHTQKILAPSLVQEIEKGKNVFLLSDGGLPAFCDPGQDLVTLCHQRKINITCSSFPNSTMLALVLSGFSHQQFFFAGFPPVESEERLKYLQKILKYSETIILMDTPYRLKKLLEELKILNLKRFLFVGMDLNLPTQEYFYGNVNEALLNITQFKREFVLVISSLKAL